MKPSHKKKSKEEFKVEPDTDDADDTRPVRFEALAELTSSEVVAQVKMGMSQIAPLGELEGLEADSEDESTSEEEAA